MMYGWSLGVFYLPRFKLNRGGTSKNGNGNEKLARFVVNLLDNAILPFKGSVTDLNGVSGLKGDGGANAFLALFDLAEHTVNLTLTHGDRLAFSACEANDAVHFLNEIPDFIDKVLLTIKKHHVNDDISWEKLALGFYFFAFAVFFNAFLRDKNIENNVTQFLGFNLAFNTIADFLLLAGENVDDVPLLACFWNYWHGWWVVKSVGVIGGKSNKRKNLAWLGGLALGV